RATRAAERTVCNSGWKNVKYNPENNSMAMKAAAAQPYAGFQPETSRFAARLPTCNHPAPAGSASPSRYRFRRKSQYCSGSSLLRRQRSISPRITMRFSGSMDLSPLQRKSGHPCCPARIGMDRVRLFEKIFQPLAPARMPQFAKRLRLDLADALPGDAEHLADFLQRPGPPVIEAEAQAQHVFLPFRQRIQHVFQLLLEQLVGGGVGGGQRVLVFDEIAEVGVVLLPDRRFQRHRLLGDLH